MKKLIITKIRAVTAYRLYRLCRHRNLDRRYGSSFGWVPILFFGSGIPIAIWQIADSRPRLIIDEHGVLDRTPGASALPEAILKRLT